MPYLYPAPKIVTRAAWGADEKPLLGSPDSCPMRHTGYCIGGELVVRMIDTGIETRIGAGDFFEIPPGHDAYVEGSYRDFQGKSLMLKVKKSTVSTVGNDGTTTDLSYGLVGNDLELYNDRVLIRLQRPGSSTDTGGSGGGSGS